MPRWEADAEGRLQRAALELFDEHGFDRTTVAQIAKRAGLNERSFYRYFADKREVLFDGGDDLEVYLTQALEEAPAGTSPLDALLAVLADAARMFLPKELLRTRERVINANPQLRERELIKMDAIHTALVAALQARGADETAARLATDMTISIWRLAAERWLRGEDSTFAAEVRDVTRQLRRLAADSRTDGEDEAAGAPVRRPRARAQS